MLSLYPSYLPKKKKSLVAIVHTLSCPQLFIWKDKNRLIKIDFLEKRYIPRKGDYSDISNEDKSWDAYFLGHDTVPHFPSW
jgi:hypothetical protein